MINIAKDFSQFPGGRFKTDGPASGEEFREKLLLPELSGGAQLVVVLDGVAGLPSSFLEEAFGGLVRAGYAPDYLRKHLCLVANTSRMKRYPSLVWEYVETASASSRAH